MKLYFVTTGGFEFDEDEWKCQKIFLEKENAITEFLKEVNEAREKYGNTVIEEQSDRYYYEWYKNYSTIYVEMTETETED